MPPTDIPVLSESEQKVVRRLEDLQARGKLRFVFRFVLLFGVMVPFAGATLMVLPAIARGRHDYWPLYVIGTVIFSITSVPIAFMRWHRLAYDIDRARRGRNAIASPAVREAFVLFLFSLAFLFVGELLALKFRQSGAVWTIMAMICGSCLNVFSVYRAVRSCSTEPKGSAKRLTAVGTTVLMFLFLFTVVPLMVILGIYVVK